MEQHSNIRSIQFGIRGGRDSPLPRLHRTDQTQDVSMDEKETNTSSSREKEGLTRTSDRILSERLHNDITRYRIDIERQYPKLGITISSLIQLSIQLGEIKERLLHYYSDETSEEESSTEDEGDDTEGSDQ